MGDSLSLVFSMIVAILIMFMFPMMDSWERQDDLSYMLAYTATVDFVDGVRNTGVLTKSMLNTFNGKLAATGNSYDIILEHREYKIVPASPTSDESVIVYLNHYTKEIDDAIESASGEYYFNKGDYFYVSVKNTNKTQATVMKEAVYGLPIDSFKIGVPYGGQIKSSYR